MRAVEVVRSLRVDGCRDSEWITLRASSAASDRGPWREATLIIDRPEQLGQVAVGDEFFLDLIPLSLVQSACPDNKPPSSAACSRSS